MSAKIRFGTSFYFEPSMGVDSWKDFPHHNEYETFMPVRGIDVYFFTHEGDLIGTIQSNTYGEVLIPQTIPSEGVKVGISYLPFLQRGTSLLEMETSVFWKGRHPFIWKEPLHDKDNLLIISSGYEPSQDVYQLATQYVKGESFRIPRPTPVTTPTAPEPDPITTPEPDPITTPVAVTDEIEEVPCPFPWWLLLVGFFAGTMMRREE